MQNWPISERIRKWYKNKYGNRLNIYLNLGRMAVLIKKDLWVFSFPRIFGTARFIASKTYKSDQIVFQGKPLVCNILDSIEDMPQDFRLSLTDTQVSSLLNDFMLGFDAMMTLETINSDLVKLAISDISASVDHLIAQSPQYGSSKWSSLQAAEKIIKAGIELSGQQYKNLS